MENLEGLKRQFLHNKEKAAQLKAKTRKQWKYTLGGVGTSVVVFMGGAALEAGTKFFKESLPSQLKRGMCYASDVLRFNAYPQQYTIVVLPLEKDRDDLDREAAVTAFRSTVYDVNVITPCVPITIGIKGGKNNNKIAYSQEIEALFEKYKSDLVVTGEVNQQRVKLQAYAIRDVRAKKFLAKGQSDSDIRDPTEPAAEMFDHNDPAKVGKFLIANISRSLKSDLREIRCSDLGLMECEYPKGIEVPTDVLSLVSKVSMVFSNDLPDDRQEILERDTSLWESRDYYDALSIYRDNMKATPTMAMSATTLPVMLNLMYRHGQSTYIDSDGKKRSIFHLADLILFSMAASTWESSSLSGLFSQKYGGICQDANSLRESLARFQNAIKSIEGEKRAADPRYALAQLWLGQSQVLLYDNGKKEDREAMKQSLPKAIADLERTQTQWSSPKAGDLKVRFDSELASLRKANDRMNAPWWDFRAGPGNTSLMPCPR